MWRRIVATFLACSLPAMASAGPLADAAAREARRQALAQTDGAGGRGRFWTGLALIGAGGVLAALGGSELGGEDNAANEPPEPEDGGEGTGKAMLAGGLAAAALGGVLLFTGRRSSGPAVSMQPGRVAVRQTVRF